ncbi:MAG: Gfo/Idh/MocA family oxidoreductase [Kosmotogaceae bacterium]
MEKVKVGIIGSGKMGITHCGAFMTLDNTTIFSACDSNKENLDVLVNGHWPEIEYYDGDFESKYVIEEKYENYSEMINNSDIDAVIVSTPNASHYEIVKEALENNKHVLVEKPFTVDYKKALELVKLADQKGLVLSVGQCWRFHPHIQYAKKIIDSGILGEITKVKGYGIHESYVPSSSWFSQKSFSGGGALIDMGIHPIDTINYIMENIRINSVVGNFITAYGEYDVEDIGVSLLFFESGATGIVEFGWSNPHTDGVESSVQIFGTNGYMRVFPSSIKLDVESKKGEFFPDICDWYLTKELYIRQAESFINCILHGKNNINSGLKNLETMKVINAIYKSKEENRIVLLEEF